MGAACDLLADVFPSAGLPLDIEPPQHVGSWQENGEGGGDGGGGRGAESSSLQNQAPAQDSSSGWLVLTSDERHDEVRR